MLTAVLKIPGLVQERLHPGEGMKWWDKLYFAVSSPLDLGSIVLAAMDAGRFGWTKIVPVPLYIAGIAAMAAGHCIFIWAKTTNRFFSSVVRIQTDRGQTVCREGPYKIIRHPGYLGGILLGMATPVVLGSLWGLLPAAFGHFMLVIRAYLEDEMLQRELPGYSEYAKEVKYRLIPGVW
jgi:protein-S-isoprenylcysteine O-methyltransferase Ste14